MLRIIMILFVTLYPNPLAALNPTIRGSFGVAVHERTFAESDADLMEAAQIAYGRLDVFWHKVETSKSTYDWHRYDRVINALTSANVRPLIILSYSNNLYEPEILISDTTYNVDKRTVLPPTSQLSRSAFADYAVAVYKRYAHTQPILEIWNEPNHPVFWPPQPDAEAYAALVAATCSALKQSTPSARIIGPAITSLNPHYGDARRFVTTISQSPVRDCFDLVSFHLYQDAPNSSNIADQVAFMRHAFSNRDIAITEYGYSTYRVADELHSPRRFTINAATQAAHLVQQHILHLLNGVVVSIWYDWRDDGREAGQREHNFGLLTFDGQPKAAYRAIAFLNRVVGDYSVTRTIKTNIDGATAILLTAPSGQTAVIAWTKGPPRAITIPTSLLRRFQCVDILERSIPCTVTDSGVRAVISNIPAILW